MAKQLNVNLAFSADTSKVKAQLQDLQNQLTKLTLSSKTELGITREIEEASRAAAELSVHLRNATNQQTGTLDFSKLNQSIKQSGVSLQQYGRTLQSLGPQGQQAFMSLAQAVANSEVPIRRTNAMLKEMGTTLANTARWQLSSSMLHGFMGAVQSAYGYAQDLNESLNNIRIVTGQNIDQMAKFAEEANKAARALSTTTTEYTNASLIYYQQGLSDSQVKERTDITIKMANVARQSAEVVSDQMTAVWNNFYDGSKSLEHYADVMTALGAATASSTDEIAEGLNKFAAVADTVGLSYEYAASALATVTATTRQSADVVGTAFKTLFARIQDLELGKTLEDGTSLGKYSAALESVGIQVKDASGGLRDMDDILDDLGNKWNNLSKDTQVALAQTVAGVRQYTQLIALMDNWDFMKQNLATSNASSGALQAQADIYAESWEAAADRVTAAAESVYEALINDDFFIDLLNNIEKIISFVDRLIDNLGGLKGVLTAIGAIVTKVFANQLSQGLTNIVYNVKMLTKAGREAEQANRKKVIDDAIGSIPKSKEFSTQTEKAQQESMRSQLTLQQEMLANADKMNGYEQARNQMLLDRNKQLQEQAVLAAKAEDAAIQKRGKAIDVVQTRVAANNGGDQAKQLQILRQITAETGKMKESFRVHNEIDSLFQAFQRGGQKGSAEVKKLQSQITSLKSGNPVVQSLIDSMGDYDLTIENVEENITTLKAQIKALVTDSATSLKQTIIPEDQMDEGAAEIDNLVVSIEEQTDAEMRRKAAVQEGAQAHQSAAEAIRTSIGSQKQWSDILVESANLAFSAGTALQMLGHAFETLRSPDVSGWDKFLTVLTTLGMVLPTLVSLFSTLKTLLSAENVAKLANIAATLGQVAAEKALNKEKNKSNITTKKSIKETWQDTRQKLSNTGKNIKDKFGQVKGKFGQLKNNFNTSAWHKSQGMMQGPGTAQQVSAAGKTAVKGLGGMAASVGFIIAGIAIIAGGIKWGIAQATKAEKAIEKAKVKVQELQSNLESVNNTYTDFASKVDAFNSASSGLDNLTKGTQEYKKAVYEANEAAMALIESNKNLSYSIVDGVITFDEGELSRALSAQQSTMVRAQAAKYAADQELLLAQENLKKRDLSRELSSSQDADQQASNVWGAIGTGALGGAGIGAGIGTAVGGWAMGLGTAIGAVIGLVAGAVTGLVTGLTANAVIGSSVTSENEALDRIAKAYEKNNSFMAKDDTDLKDFLSKSIEEGGLGINDPKLVDSLVKNRDSVDTLAKGMVQNSAMINAQNDLIAGQLLSDNNIVANSKYQDDIVDKAGDIYGIEKAKAEQSGSTKQWGTTGISQATGVNKEAEKVWKEYLHYAGLDANNFKLRDTTGNDNNRIFVYYDEKEGKEKQISLESMRYAKVVYEASHEAEIRAMELTAKLLEWEKREDPHANAMLSFLSNGDFTDSTFGEMSQIYSSAKDNTEGFLKAMLGEDLNAAAEQYGYANAQALVLAFNTALDEGFNSLSDINLPENLTQDIVSNMTIGTEQSLENLIKIMNTGPMGEQAGQEFMAGINKALEGLDPEKQQEALQKITEIDWSSYDAAYQVQDVIESLGGTVNMTSEEFALWANTMNYANSAIFDYAQQCEDLKKILELSENIEIGGYITQEDYDLLSKYNDELQEYFILTSNGARFMGDPLDFLQATDTTVLEAKKKAIIDTMQSIANAEAHMKTTENAKKYLGGTNNVSAAWNAEAKEIKEYVEASTNGWEAAGNGVMNTLHLLGDAASALWGGSVDYSHNYYEDEWFGMDGKNDDGGWKVTGYEGAAIAGSYNQQIEFLKAEGYEGWDDFPTAEEATETQVNAVRDAVNGILKTRDEITTEEYEKLTGDLLASQIDYAMSATSAEERKAMLDAGDINENAYNIAATQVHNEEKWEGMDPEEVEDYAESLINAADASDLLADSLDDGSEASKEAAEDVALYTKKMNQGIKKLEDNGENWLDIVDKSDKGSEEYAEAMSGLKDAMSDVLGVSEDFLSDEFIIQNMEDIKLAAEGSAEAIDRLAIAAGKQILLDMGIKDENVLNSVLSLHDELAAKIPDIKVGATVDDTDFMTKAAQIVEKAGMTVEQANAYFRGMGFEPTFETKKVPITQELKGVETTTEVTEWGSAPGLLGGLTKYPKKMVQSSKEVTIGTKVEEMEVPALTTDGGKPNFKLTRTNAGGMNNSSSVNTGGISGSSGGSDPKPTSRTHQTDVMERYKEINDALEDSKKAMDDASRAAEGLWGAARLKKMKEVRDEMGKQLQLLRQRKVAALEDLKDDQAWLNDIAAEQGVTFTFDPNSGNISNYTQIMEALHAELRAAEIAAGPEIDTEAEQEAIDAVNDKIKALEEAIGIYDATKEEIDKTDTEIKEMIRSIQEANLEDLNLQLEMEIMIDDAQLKKIEYYLGKTKEDIWGMAEAAALMTGQGKDLFNIDLGQAEVWTDKFADFQKQYDDLVYAYTHIDPKTGETFINQEQFVKALEELQSQIYDNLGNINELDKTMIGYYGETLAAAAEELSKFTDMMDHHNEVLDHYQSLLEIMGKSKDFERMKTLLKTQVEVSKNSAEVSKANYEMLQAELAEKKAAYEALDPNDTSYEAQVIKQQWLDAQAAANEAQLKMLEDAEAWAESLKALLETELEELGDNLEKALAGDFGSLDYMMTSMERANSLQEEYLTTTNKVYETNKLMRTAQQEIDKTSNTVAKRRMAQFIEETQQMQNQNKLSQYELEIQQAKYDLLLAEIALEEAQSAKSTVRLQRDSEGNFGYVYTADQNEVANAQQQLEDAQNALYNIGLEGANKYAEQYAQTIQEMNDAVRELTEQWQNGEIASKEEYQAKMLELEEYYGEKLKQFSHLHSIAVQTDSRVANDAWTRDFAHMTTQTSTWMSAVTGYASQVGIAFGKYQQGIAEVEQYAGADLDSLKQKTENIKEENEKLVTSITDPDKGLLHAMQLEIDKVDDITKKYQDWRKEIQGAIKDQEDLAKIIGQEIENETDDDESNDRKPETETPEQTPPEGEPNGNPGDDGTPSYKKGVLSWTGNGSARIWTDSAGKTYSATSAEGRAIQTAFNKAYGANGGYKGDYFLGWNKLNADILHEKYGLSTGGYTGDWSGSFGKLAFLHQKELVLNKQDTENLLAAMEFLNRITSAIDLQAMNNSLGGLLSSPSLGHVGDESGILEQQVHIEASFPGVSDRNELEEAFNNLINQAAQYANRK